jgi:hypothetical protein
MSPFVLLIFAPGMYVDRVEVGKDHFYARYGFWFAPSTHHVAYADLREIQYVETRDSKNRINHEFHCVKKNGETVVIHEGDLVRYATGEFFNAARAAGVKVVD